MVEWTEHPLSELCSFINRGTSPAYTDHGGILVLNQKCVRDQRVVFNQARRTDIVRKQVSAERLLKPFDILVNSTGVGTLGRVAQVLKIQEKATVDSHLTIVRANQEKVHPHYLGFALRWRQSDIEALAEGSTGQTELSRTRLGQLVLLTPSHDEQISIAELLGALDVKIELNRQMNETLEAMARLFFKDWFVDFGPTRAKAEGRSPYLAPELWSLFPDALDDDDKPMGWHLTDVASVTSELRRGISPKYIDEGGVCVLNQKCIRDRAVSFAKARRHDHSAKNIIGREIIEGDILVNSTGVGILGRVAQIWTVDEPTVADSHVTIVRANNSKVSARYLGMNITGRESEIENLGEGSTGQTELSRTRLGAMDILLPDRRILTAFDETVGPLIELAVKNQSESYTLAQTRDLLLPKLMSGEIRLREAEKIVDNRL
jgi:type I restriction enzyme S subunit